MKTDADTREIPHGLQSFAVTCWQDMMKKLQFEIDQFELTRPTDSGGDVRGYRALNVAWTAWHLHDWFFEGRMDGGDLHLVVLGGIFPEIRFDARRKADRLREFGNALTEKYVSLRICRAITTAGKHGKSERHPEYDLVTTGVQPFVIGTQLLFQDVRIAFEGNYYDARDVFVRALQEWKDFFTSIGWDYPGSSRFMPYIPSP